MARSYNRPCDGRFAFQAGVLRSSCLAIRRRNCGEANAAVSLARAPEERFPTVEAFPITVALRRSRRAADRADAGGAGRAEAAGTDTGFVHSRGEEEGLWIIDQHVAHERVLFERVLRQRAARRSKASACSCRWSSNFRRRSRRCSAKLQRNWP